MSFITDATSPLPNGALRLTTDTTNAAKAQYMHLATVGIDEVATLSYNTKYVSGPPVAAASYQLAVDLNGVETAGGFTTLIYEPYWNGAVNTLGGWQNWEVDAGQFWSSSNFTDGACTVSSGAGGPPFYTLSELQTACPNAEVVAYGVSVGTYNPGYDVLVDGVVLNEVTSDFEAVVADTTDPSVPVGGLPNGTFELDNEFDFTWMPSTDDSDTVKYVFQSTMNPAESGGVLTTGLWTSGTLTNPMIHSSGAPDGTWYWQVRAKDEAGNMSAWSEIWEVTIDSVAPAVPTLVSPADNSTVTTPSF